MRRPWPNGGCCAMKRNAVEIHLSGLMEMPIHPGMQKIRIIGFFFGKNRLR
jgi:hypothetical protein